MANLRKIFSMLVLVVVTAVQAQTLQPLPTDPGTRIGKLENGLTYYIRHNEYPDNVANFYIAQRVGSIQEEDSQRGLAHFLEHMAFNGSTHFKGNELIEYLRTLGVAFGRDLNAYTSIEETVYNINNVPNTRQTALDSCLLALQDWSNGLLLKTEEIDKERGVIHGEWAMSNSATQRLFERSLPAMYPGSRYGHRLPIGIMEVVDNFKPQELRDYYEKWYHPENQAIIIIGDIDVDYTENKIKEFFSGIKKGPKAASISPIAVPDNKEAIYIFDKDKEMPYTIMSVNMKCDPMPREMRGTQVAYIQGYMTAMMRTMFSSRISELSQQPDCPFVQLSMGYGTYGVSKVKDALSADVVAKEGKDKEAFATMLREIKRVKEHGFTATEYVRAKEQFLSYREKEYSNRDKRKNDEYYRECVKHFLEGEAMPGIEVDYQLWQALAQQFNVDIINQMAKELITIDNDSNLVCYAFAQEKEGKTYFTAEDMKKTMAEVRAEKLEPWVDNVKNEPLISQLPAPGKIKKEVKNDALGYTELQLSNGAKVILKKTDFKNDEIRFSGFAPGGKAMYGEADYSNLKLFEAAISTVGMGNFTNNELEKALAGKVVSFNPSLGNMYSTVNGASTPKDIETLMQLIYLGFTDIRKDEKAYQAINSMLHTALKNRDIEPENQLSDSLVACLYSNNPRFSNLTVADLDKASLDRIIEIAHERFSNVNNFTFTFIGNFDEATIRPLICQYIASLPGKEKKVAPQEIRTFFKGNVNRDFKRKMEAPKPTIMQCYGAESVYNLKNDILTDYTGQLLSMVLLKVIREEASLTYTIGAGAQLIPMKDKARINVMIQSPIGKPEDVDKALELINKCVNDVAAKADPEMVAKIKANFLKNADVNAKQNNYWANVIETKCIYGVDTHTEYKKIVESITPEEISAFLKNNILSAGNFLNIVMRPE